MQHVGPGSDIGKGPRSLQYQKKWESRDPITDMETDTSINVNIEKELSEAIELAENASFPDERDLFEDVY